MTGGRYPANGGGTWVRGPRTRLAGIVQGVRRTFWINVGDPGSGPGLGRFRLPAKR